MRHVRRITVAPADSKQFGDPLGAVFLQIWLSVFAFMLSTALGDK